MSITGIGIDYSNICKDYNTAYLDRDNKDPATSKCMKAVVKWTNKFLTELLEEFGYQINYLSGDTLVKIDDVAANRFLFYSLEKEITLQSYVIQKEYVEYDSLSAWATKSDEGILIQNDEDGQGIYLYFKKDSKEQEWIMNTLKAFSLDEVDFEAVR